MANTESKGKSLAVTIISVLLALAFLGSGGMKLIAGGEVVEQFTRWGYPAWFASVTALVELAGAVLILIPATRFYGAGLLVCTMVGAVLTHLKAGEASMVAPPLVLLVLSSWVTWVRRP